MLDSARLFHLLKVLAPAIVFFWILAYLTVPDSTYHDVLRQFRDEKELFVADFLQHEVDGSFDGAPIAELCKTRTWTPGLIVSCEPPYGGVGQVKNAHLHCIRIAMEMGAELILPDIVRRSETDISQVLPNGGGPRRGVSMEYFFDRQHLNATLSEHCPQMKLHFSINDLYDSPSMLTPVQVSIQSLATELVNGTVLAKPQELGKQIEDFLEEKSPSKKRKYPFHVHLFHAQFMFPTAHDAPDFAANFGRILRIRKDARELAGSAVFNMHKMFDLNLDPRNGIKNESFLGVHLRTEKDVEGKFADYETQAANYLAYMTANHMQVVFLATGATGDNITAFAERAKDFNATVVMKKDVLEGADLDTLNGFSWDQRALVDYEIMLRAGLVAGTAESSFAWNLAMRRKYAYGVSESSLPQDTEGSVQWHDRYSIIFGKTTEGEAMQLTIWP